MRLQRERPLAQPRQVAPHCHEQQRLPPAHALDAHAHVPPPLPPYNYLSVQRSAWCVHSKRYPGLPERPFDMYHAFDSPPKILFSEVLERMGTPLKPLRLIQTVLDHGSTFIRGSPEEVFRTTHGVKQGCPLSCFLFVLIFEIPSGTSEPRDSPYLPMSTMRPHPSRSATGISLCLKYSGD